MRKKKTKLNKKLKKQLLQKHVRMHKVTLALFSLFVLANRRGASLLSTERRCKTWEVAYNVWLQICEGERERKWEEVSDRSALGEWTSRVGGNSHDWQVGSTSEVARSCTQVFLGVGTLARWRGVLRSECAEGWSAAFLLGEILGSFFKSKSTIAQNTLSPGTDIRIILCCFTTELRVYICQ